MSYFNHYKYIELHGEKFSQKLGLSENIASYLSAHGDKCHSLKMEAQERGLHPGKAAMVYLLTYITPYSQQVRNTENGWVSPYDWCLEVLRETPYSSETVLKIQEALRSLPDEMEQLEP